MKVNGAIISGVKEIVINHSVYSKTADGYWIHKGKNQTTELSHVFMCNKYHRAAASGQFKVWVSGNTINVLNPDLFPRT
jgi:hypothetical protein